MRPRDDRLAYAAFMPSVPFAESPALEVALQLGPLAVVAALYLRRVRTLSRSRHEVPIWRQACFLTGFAMLAVSLSALGSVSDELLYAHMIEHLLIGDLATLLHERLAPVQGAGVAAALGGVALLAAG